MTEQEIGDGFSQGGYVKKGDFDLVSRAYPQEYECEFLGKIDKGILEKINMRGGDGQSKSIIINIAENGNITKIGD